MRISVEPKEAPSVCPLCRDELAATDATVQCDRCAVPYHAECLTLSERCALLACGGWLTKRAVGARRALVVAGAALREDARSRAAVELVARLLGVARADARLKLAGSLPKLLCHGSPARLAALRGELRSAGLDAHVVDPRALLRPVFTVRSVGRDDEGALFLSDEAGRSRRLELGAPSLVVLGRDTPSEGARRGLGERAFVHVYLDEEGAPPLHFEDRQLRDYRFLGDAMAVSASQNFRRLSALLEEGARVDDRLTRTTPPSQTNHVSEGAGSTMLAMSALIAWLDAEQRRPSAPASEARGAVTSAASEVNLLTPGRAPAAVTRVEARLVEPLEPAPGGERESGEAPVAAAALAALGELTDLQAQRRETERLARGLAGLCAARGWSLDALLGPERPLPARPAAGERIALIGTSASPITNGHLTMGLEILALTDVDRVWYYLVGEHPWGKELMPAEHRRAMAELATARTPRLEVCDFEMREGARIYGETTETAEILERFFLPCYPQQQFCWVMGSDVAQSFHEWRGAEAMAERLDIFVIHRLGYDFDKASSLLSDPRHQYLKEDIVTSNISSSLVRARGRDYDQQRVLALVPEVVWRYLVEHRLLDPGVLEP